MGSETATTYEERDVTADRGEEGEYDELRFAVASIAGGVVGTSLMTVVLALVNNLYTPRLQVFREVAQLAGAEVGFLTGFLLFFGAGALAWPLMYATLGPYLPGSTRVQQGLVFAAVLWLGFVVAFAGNYTGPDLIVFLAFSVVSHLIYGGVLGFVAARLTHQPGSADVPV